MSNIPLPTVEQMLSIALKHHQDGQLEAAEAVYRQILAVAPENFDALHLIGVLSHQKGDTVSAVDWLNKALQVYDGDAAIYSNLGVMLKTLGRLQEAEYAYRQAISIAPTYTEAYSNLGSTLHELGCLEEAIVVYQQAIALKPDFAEAHNNLGNAFNELGRWDEAKVAYDRAINAKPDFADAYNNKGGILRLLGCLEEAEVAYRQAIALNPHDFKAFKNIGGVFHDCGRLEEAELAHRQAIILKPDYAEAYYNLGLVKRFKAADPDLGAIENLLLQQSQLPEKDLIYLHYAVGKGYADVGESKRSFESYLEGNRLKRASYTYDVAIDERLFAATAKKFTIEHLLAAQGNGNPTTAPVFIVGMPRSGTTLTEQILASHPQVHGAGERSDLQNIVAAVGRAKAAEFPQWIDTLSPADLLQIGQAYQENVVTKAQPALRVTDKMPVNFLYLGLISMVLPNSRIIHVRRNPVDTCLSCFTQLFTTGQYYSYDLKELGRYYRAYERLMEHWRRVLPAGAMLEVQYENLVDNLEEEARKLVAHCGLEWDPTCLEFHKTDRPVQTASATQVRQPIYKSSVEKWRKYEPWLGELLEVLKG